MTKTVRRVRKRTRGRELALQYLYQWDLLGADLAEDMEGFLQAQESEEEAIEFARMILSAIREPCASLRPLLTVTSSSATRPSRSLTVP